jgi:hypothetical protein
MVPGSSVRVRLIANQGLAELMSQECQPYARRLVPEGAPSRRTSRPWKKIELQTTRRTDITLLACASLYWSAPVNAQECAGYAPDYSRMETIGFGAMPRR